MVKLLILPLLLSVAACGSVPVKCDVQEVKTVVVAEQPEPPVFVRPVLPIAGLKADSGPEAMVRAYTATVQILKDEVEMRDIALQVYRKDSHD